MAYALSRGELIVEVGRDEVAEERGGENRDEHEDLMRVGVRVRVGLGL